MSPSLQAVILIFLGLRAYVGSSSAAFRTSLCAPGRLEVGGVEVVERNRGRILLTLKSGLQCQECHKHLREFSLMVESISDLSVAILVPGSEHPSAVRHSQLEFPKLQLLHDAAGVTGLWLEEQQILFDRCGRVSKIIHVREGTPLFHDALEAVRAAVSHAQCGWCQYDTRGARDLSRKQFDAYIRNDKRNGQDRNYQRREDYGQRGQKQGRGDHSRQEQQRQQQYQEPQRQYNYHHQHSQAQQPPPPQYQQVHQQGHDPRQQYYQQSYNSPPQHQQFNNASQERPRPQDPQYQGHGQDQRRSDWERASTTSTTPRPVKKLHYSEDSDYGDYMDESVGTTSATETQIPRPQSPKPWWPTHIPTTIDYRLLMGADVPCAAFTDDICFMQQEKLGRDQLPKCCSKGLYLTDLCIPGKCSNSTTQLCCLQKFLQAKYSCCEDESQSDATTTTNRFSQCCYSKFVAKDDCCTAERADDYWSSVHELCYPNTKVDLSTVKLEVRFAEGMRVIDLAENRIWEHECKHGGNRMQLAYFP